MASTKNVIMVDENNTSKNSFLFCKQSLDRFYCEIAYPLSPFIGMGLILSMFDFKILIQWLLLAITYDDEGSNKLMLCKDHYLTSTSFLVIIARSIGHDFLIFIQLFRHYSWKIWLHDFIFKITSFSLNETRQMAHIYSSHLLLYSIYSILLFMYCLRLNCLVSLQFRIYVMPKIRPIKINPASEPMYTFL